MPRPLSLLAFALLLSACASTPRTAPPAPAAAVVAGPMLGHVTHRTAALWLQTDRPGQVRIAYRDAAGAADTTAALATTAAGDHIAKVTLGGLEPGTAYTYSVLVDGDAVAFDYPTVFSTQPLWQWRTDPPEVTVAIGSCHYSADTPYDRPGDPYGGEYGIFEAIRAQAPDAMLWLGDNVYLREVDWWSRWGIRYRYAHMRRQDYLQPLLAATAHYATWDDHDYGPNNSDRSYVLKEAALEAFNDYWLNPTAGLPGVPGVFTHFEVGDAAFFVLDDRWYRAPEGTPEGEGNDLLGEQQLTWLLDALAGSYAPFKIVAVGSQVLNTSSRYESFANHPAERQRLLDGLRARDVHGVVFITGDRHHTELLRLDREGAYPLYDFTSSPLTSGAGAPRGAEADNPLRVPGTLVAGERNFGTLTFTGPRTDRTLTMRTFNTEGELLWEHAVRARDLRPAE